MELTNKQSEPAVVTANDNLQAQIDAVVTQKVERVKSFREYAFEKAGLNRGDYLSLKTYLKWIKDGHLVDETYNENEQHLLKRQVENKIITKEDEKEKIYGEKRTAIEVIKPSLEKKIKDLNDEIQQTKIDLIDNKVLTGYESIRFFSYACLTILLTLYLIFFYSSSIYSSFFRNPESMIKNGGSDIVMLLDSIFDPKGIFTLSTALIFSYLGSFIFFAIGMAPHAILNGDGKFKKMKAGLIIFLAFIADSALAFKIDKGLHDLKIMAGVADSDWKFYSSINFYLVLLFGFAAYLVWGFTYEMMLKEKNKKTGDLRAALIIKGLKEEIKALRSELQVLETKIIELETQIKSILSQLEQLKKDLENRMLNPDALSQNLTSFYMGWLQYLNCTDLGLEKVRCEETFNDFILSQFNQTAAILN
jgi:hypothetical protein